MVERASGPRLGDEPVEPTGIDRQSTVQNLERDLTLEPRIPGPIHFSPASLPDQLENPVGPRRRPRSSINVHEALMILTLTDPM
jgi:hypothetical protein